MRLRRRAAPAGALTVLALALALSDRAEAATVQISYTLTIERVALVNALGSIDPTTVREASALAEFEVEGGVIQQGPATVLEFALDFDFTGTLGVDALAGRGQGRLLSPVAGTLTGDQLTVAQGALQAAFEGSVAGTCTGFCPSGPSFDFDLSPRLLHTTGQGGHPQTPGGPTPPPEFLGTFLADLGSGPLGIDLSLGGNETARTPESAALPLLALGALAKAARRRRRSLTGRGSPGPQPSWRWNCCMSK